MVYKETGKVSPILKNLMDNSEKIVALVIGKVFKYNTAEHGLDGEEPDWIFDNVHKYEVTLICDVFFKNEALSSEEWGKKYKDVVIKRIKTKANKKYVNKDVNLCLVSLSSVYSLILPKIIDEIFVTMRSTILMELKQNALDKVFKNIFIFMPADSYWILVDLLNSKYYNVYIGEDFDDPNNYTVTEIQL